MSYIYKERELYYTNYTSTRANGDNPNQRHPLDSAKFDKDEKFEMLSFINRISIDLNFNSCSQCRLVEFIIQQKFPSHLSQNREKAIAWLKNVFYEWQLPDILKDPLAHAQYPNG